MPITTRPIFDCQSCDAYEQQGPDPRKGICRRVLCGQITGVDKFGSPSIVSFHPPVGKGTWCLQHPMAKAFPPGVFTPRLAGEAESLVARAEVIEADDLPALRPGAMVLVEADEPPLQGEAKPEKAN